MEKHVDFNELYFLQNPRKKDRLSMQQAWNEW